MTPIEDLEPGMWVAIVGMKYAPPKQVSLWSAWGDDRQVETTYTGAPLKLIAKSLPFICVESEGRRAGLDVRQFEFQKLDEEYVKAMVTEPQTLHDVVICGNGTAYWKPK